jgi:hypothetical protein
MPGKNDTVVLEDVEIRFRNFAGREGMYNTAGDRNFAVLLPKHIADEMARDGWNVKLLKARDEDEEDQPYISVKVNFKSRRPPLIKMISDTTGRTTVLDEDSVDILDFVDVKNVDLIINPYEWNVGGKGGVKAYLQDLYITIYENPLEVKYADIATVDGPMMERTEMHVPEDR